jgi:hypothetical protein
MEGYKQQKTDIVWHVERQVRMYARITNGSDHRISERAIGFCGVRGVQIEQAGH